MIYKIFLGEDRNGRKVFYTTLNSWGVTVIEGSTRTGKTQISRIVYLPIATRFKRLTLIIDYLGEHKFSKFSNLATRHGYGISWLTSVSNIVFKISEFNSPEDWETLGFPDMARLVLARIAREAKQYHGENFDTFYKIIREYPTEKAFNEFQIKKFETNWHFKPDSPIYETSQKSILSRLPDFKYLFWNENDKDTVWIEDFARLLIQSKCLHVSLDLRKESRWQVLRSRIIVGKILQDLFEFGLEKLKPLIVFEEADKVYPNWPESEPEPISLTRIKALVTKGQKFGVELIFITQNISMLHSSAEENYHTIISGPGGDYAEDARKLKINLRWDIDTGEREFLLIRKGKNWQEIFTPTEVPCLIRTF